ncbi:hypothetical protein BN1708_008678 [Verticillium longisporum]|uniref:Uncharacterized protein n=1 Tax=Verticillium longisporum TaxID=100787 RepID=A0A0G4N6N5_VERLO|nr:hypothetical protein BN1708_008678 [Verticillium longisporum]
MLETRLMDRWKRTDRNIIGPHVIGLKSTNPCHYPEAGFSRPESCAVKTHSRTTSFLPTAPSQPQLNRRFAPTSTYITMAGPPPNPLYPTQFRSKFGPKYHYKPSVAGLNFTQLSRIGVKLGAFGGVALFGVIFIASNVPRLRRDVLQNVPVIGGLFVKEPLPASDNPF